MTQHKHALKLFLSGDLRSGRMHPRFRRERAVFRGKVAKDHLTEERQSTAIYSARADMAPNLYYGLFGS